MGLSSSKKSRMQRRLKEVRKESELVRDDINALSRMLRSRDGVESLPKLKSDRLVSNPIPPPTRGDPVPRRAEPPSSEAERKGGGVQQARQPRAPRATKSPSRIQPVERITADEEVAARPAVAQDEKFASYFSSGGFLGAPPMRQEKNVQRNKAVFMVVVVGIVFFIVFQLVFQ